jgi:cellulose synthase/poly-beta-1,6-N-acetylglucosamine synthase-like glycosyltransferase/spore germination protein YaaH/peptidoglycan/xylan/chitin deacetylase (PgdA/CDA1 family)
MSDVAIFFDPSRRRWWWIKRVGTLFGLFAVVTISVWLVSLLTLPFLPDIPGITVPIRRNLKRAINLPRHSARLTQFAAKRYQAKLLTQINNDNRAYLAKASKPPIKANNIVAAFYAPWLETGLHSLKANAPKMTHLMPSWVHLQEGARGLDLHDWDPAMVPHNKEVLKIARESNLNIMPVFSNAELSDFDSKRVHILLTSPAIQTDIINQLRQWVLINNFQGINVDFENMPESDHALYLPFLRRLKAAFAPYHLAVSADLEASQDINWREAASICDFVVVMAYDENGAGTKTPGPIASIGWYRGVLARAQREIPADKLVLGLANYAYDWEEGRDWADPLNYQSALIAAEKYRDGEKPEQIVDFDDQYMNPTFQYDDDAGKHHEVWFLDAVTAANQWAIAQRRGVHGVAVWVLGSTDPSIWEFLDRRSLTRPPDMRKLQTVHFPYDVDFEGEGEIAHVDAEPKDGERSLEIDPVTGLARDESYHTFPKSFVIGRTGYQPKMIALTIDDGPADPYTGQMLDVLKRYDVKATFFLIGENAERYPNLVRRIWNEGHEIGNHSFTHPNVGAITERQARLELTATQRVFQSLLHRSTVLFRPPYNADAEPTTLEEVRPIQLASEMHYITVLEFLDPQDWNTQVVENGSVRRRTAEEMLQSVEMQLRTEHGSSILLHDGGGDRRETVRLIPMLVTELRKQGYRFVTVSELLGKTRDDVNPPVKNTDRLVLASDRMVFESIYICELFLSIAFISAIILGAARVVFVSVLAIIAKVQARHAKFNEAYRPTVSVVIAAFNEEKVISRTIRAVLANRYDPLDIIVVDDGSTDGTSAEVARDFAGHPKVRLIRQENGGKASALNHGIGEATGEIIIALDADTIFARHTIEKLVRHFGNANVGAVAGNVKVGNRINPLTYWQSIEYVTSQNLDRSAYAVINAVSVVPGAVGAWRREAIVEAGGYTTDTMAEDMDLTWRIRRNGWRIETDSDAIGYTEAPDSFVALFRQRFRWAFGTLQSLWKHRRALGRYGWFGTVMLPSLWLFQVLFQVLSPLIDLQIVWTVANVAGTWMWRGHLTGDWQPLPQAVASLYVIGFMYAFFFVVELIGSLVAFKLDREDSRVLVWLFWQRFLYRQLMYAVLLKSIKTAITGIRTGWGKLDRKGTVDLVVEPEPVA